VTTAAGARKRRGKSDHHCNYADAFGDAVAAKFESASSLPGTEPLGNVLDSVIATGAGSCASISDQVATVVLTYRPESTPVDPVTYAAAAQEWLQTDGIFPMEIPVCGCTATITLTDTTSGYVGFAGKGTPKSGKCKGGYSNPKSNKKSAKKTKGKKMTSTLGSVGVPSTSVAIATVAGAAVLVAVVAMVVIKRRTPLSSVWSDNAKSDTVKDRPMIECACDESTPLAAEMSQAAVLYT
jgi:hypothetical protein